MRSFYRSGCLIACLLLLSGCEKRDSGRPQVLQATAPQKVAENPSAGSATNESRGGNKIDDSNRMNEQHEYLELVLGNSNNTVVHDAAISFVGNPCTFGYISAGSSKAYLGWQNPVGTNATVKWKEVDETEREVTVEISQKYPRDVPGELTFTIAGTNVTVGFKMRNRK